MAVGLVAAAGQASAQELSADPAADAAALLRAACGRGGDRVLRVKRRDLNDDGVRDQILIFSGRCDGAPRAFCTAAGACPVEVHLSTFETPSAEAAAFAWAGTYLAERVAFTRWRRRAALRLSGGGQVCRPGAPDPCEPVLAWSGAAFERVDGFAPPRPSAAAAAGPAVRVESGDRRAGLTLGPSGFGVDCRRGPAALGFQGAPRTPQAAEDLARAAAAARAAEADLAADPRIAEALAAGGAALAEAGRPPTGLGSRDPAAIAALQARGAGPAAYGALRLEAVTPDAARGALDRIAAACDP
ncbi:MAG: hypothetical protein AAFR16_04205 [Pseudomonadota bacterium]